MVLTAEDFHAALHPFKALQTGTSILDSKPPLATNSDFTIQHLHGLRRNIDSVPSEIRTEITCVLDDFL